MEYIIIAIVVAFVGYSIFKESKPTTVKKTPAKQSVKKTPSVAELKKLTKVQLLEHADKNNIKVKRSGSKAEVVKSISQHK